MDKFLIENGEILNVRQVPSPHFDARPQGKMGEISLLVIHYISLPPDKFGANFIDDFFQGRLDPNAHPYFEHLANVRVSAHCLINRKGEITQYVNLNDRAWHAGLSQWHGREKCNDFAIGIELEGSNNQPFTSAQYATLVELTHAIQKAYPQITSDRIVGHCHIAPKRKIDPGQYFNWTGYFNTLKARSE